MIPHSKKLWTLSISLWCISASLTVAQNDNTILYNVSEENQSFDPNLGTWENGSTVTILPNSTDNNDLGSGARILPRTNKSGLQEANYFLDSTVDNNPQQIIKLLSENPTATATLPTGVHTIVIDTGSITTLKNFALKSFGAETTVLIEATNDTSKESNWKAIQSNIAFNANNPLNVKLDNTVARYLRITFNTTRSGPVGCLHIEGKKEGFTGTALTSTTETAKKDENTQNSIEKVIYISGGELKNVKNIYDGDFRTTYAFAPTEPAIVILKTNATGQQKGIQDIGILLNNQISGNIDVYAVNALPILENSNNKQLSKDNIAYLEKTFATTHTPVITLPIGEDGRASGHLQEAEKSQYLILHVKPNSTLVNATKTAKGAPGDPEGVNIAETYFGPTENTEDQNNRSLALQNALARRGTIEANTVAPRLPPATTVTP